MLCYRNVLYNNAAAKECVEVFLTHAIRPVMMIIQISGHNRARQRDKWARLLEEFAALQDEVYTVTQKNLMSFSWNVALPLHLPLPGKSCIVMTSLFT